MRKLPYHCLSIIVSNRQTNMSLGECRMIELHSIKCQNAISLNPSWQRCQNVFSSNANFTIEVWVCDLDTSATQTEGNWNPGYTTWRVSSGRTYFYKGKNVLFKLAERGPMNQENHWRDRNNQAVTFPLRLEWAEVRENDKCKGS